MKEKIKQLVEFSPSIVEEKLLAFKVEQTKSAILILNGTMLYYNNSYQNAVKAFKKDKDCVKFAVAVLPLYKEEMTKIKG